MNCLRSHLKSAGLLLGLCGIAVVLAGCGSALQDEPTFSEVPALAGPAGAAAAPVGALPPPGSAGPTNPATSPNRFRIGDTVTVIFSGVDQASLPPAHEERITEDGTITLQYLKPVVALGKTPGELQKEITDAYVPKYFTHLVVTVRGFELFFFVSGEVRSPNKVPWTGELRVTQAISACGDFTDFANRKNVQLIRVDGTSLTVNCVKALGDSKLDPKVMPGDTIKVHRRWW